jgi:hypothetical protein
MQLHPLIHLHLTSVDSEARVSCNPAGHRQQQCDCTLCYASAMHRQRFKIVLAAIGVIPACGNSRESASVDATPAVTDISGWYDVISNVGGACGMTTPDPLPPKFVWIDRLQNTFYVKYCQMPNSQSSCGGSAFPDLNQLTDLGVSGRGGSAFFSAGCSLSSDHVTATTSAAGLVIKSLTVSILGDTTIAESKCTLAAAYALTAPCTAERQIVLRKRS